MRLETSHHVGGCNRIMNGSSCIKLLYEYYTLIAYRCPSVSVYFSYPMFCHFFFKKHWFGWFLICITNFYCHFYFHKKAHHKTMETLSSQALFMRGIHAKVLTCFYKILFLKKNVPCFRGHYHLYSIRPNFYWVAWDVNR